MLRIKNEYTIRVMLRKLSDGYTIKTVEHFSINTDKRKNVDPCVECSDLICVISRTPNIDICHLYANRLFKDKI